MSRNANGGTLRPVQTGQVDLVLGRWAGSAGGNCTRTTGMGVASINATAAGLYTLTLSQTYQELLAYSFCVGGVDGIAADQKDVCMRTYNAAAGTLTLVIVDKAATPAVANLAAGEELSFRIDLRSQGPAST